MGYVETQVGTKIDVNTKKEIETASGKGLGKS